MGSNFALLGSASFPSLYGCRHEHYLYMIRCTLFSVSSSAVAIFLFFVFCVWKMKDSSNTSFLAASHQYLVCFYLASHFLPSNCPRRDVADFLNSRQRSARAGSELGATEIRPYAGTDAILYDGRHHGHVYQQRQAVEGPPTESDRAQEHESQACAYRRCVVCACIFFV